MTEVLSFLQGGVRVFQHLLTRSNVTKMLKQGWLSLTSYCIFTGIIVLERTVLIKVALLVNCLLIQEGKGLTCLLLRVLSTSKYHF